MLGKNKVFACLMGGILAAALAMPAPGATITWTADRDGDWSVGANWDLQRAPTADDDVIHDGSGKGVIRVDIPDARCKTFTATAGGTPLRGLRILSNKKLTVGIPNNPPPGNRLSFRVLAQTEQVRYLTELKEFGEFHTQMGDGIDGGDFLLQPHSFMNYNGTTTHPKGGVWTLRGGRFYSTESEGRLGEIEGFGAPGEGGKVVVEKGGSFMLVYADVYLDEIEVQPGGAFYAGDIHPEVKVTNTGGVFGAGRLLLDPAAQARLATFSAGGLARHFGSFMQIFVGTGHSFQYDGTGSLLEITGLKFQADVPNPTDGGVCKPGNAGATVRAVPKNDVSIFTKGAAFENWDGRGVTIVGPKAATAPPTLEAYYPDLGPYLFEDVACSHWAGIHIEKDAALEIRDDVVENFNHGNVATKDAVYVRGTVLMESGATLDLNGLNIYHAGAETNTGQYVIVDGGAVVKVFALKYGDFDGDGDVDSEDYVRYFQPAYSGSGNPTDCPLADADCDTDVDTADYVKFQVNYTGSNPTLPPVGMAPCGGSEGGGPSSPQQTMSPLEEQAAFILANFERDQISLWVSVLGDRASRAATPEQRAELETLATLLANGIAP